MPESQFQLKNRFKRQFLTFNGKSSKDFLLYLSGPGVYDSPAPDVESISIPGLNGELIQNNASSGHRRFSNVDIKYEAFFFNGLPAKTAAVKSWLLSPTGYCKLQDTYDPNFFRMATCTSAVEFDVSNQKAAQMDLVFNCKPQRWNVEGQKPIDIPSSGTVIRNPYPFYSQPLIIVAGTGTITIGDYSVQVNATEVATVNKVVYTMRVCLDSETQNAYVSEEYQEISGAFSSGFFNSGIYSEEFPVLAPGDNEIIYEGFSSVQIIPRWWTL